MNFTMNCPTPIQFGAGTFDRLAEYGLPGKKALVVMSDDHIAETFGLWPRLTAQLDDMGIAYAPYFGAQPNPVIANVMDGAQLARETGCDFIIGLGGGSTLDCAKGISLMIRNEGDYWDYVVGARTITQPRVPVVTITTTAGTGTEIAPFFVISNEVECAKVGFPKPMRYNTWPVLAVVDPTLMTTIPPEFTAYQAFDAFAHCAESFLSNKANTMSNMYSVAGIKAVVDYAERAVKNGSDLEARTKLAFASVCSGVVMSVGSSTGKHSLEHGMSAYHNDLPHAAGLLMINRAYYKMLMSKHVVDDRFIELAWLMGHPHPTKPEDFLTQLEGLMEACGVADLKMSDYGITPDEFPTFLHNARTTAIGYLFGSDSAVLGDEDCLTIYRESYR